MSEPLQSSRALQLLSLLGAPPLGWHSWEILKEIGYGLRFEELITAGVVATAEEH
jgi:hypothetical protein